MIFGRKQTEKTNEEELFVPVFGYDLLKQDVLPELLGNEHHTILYWAGKSLARKYPVSSIEDLITFFQKAGWGNLTLLKEKSSEAFFELTSPLFEGKKEIATPLEAGFLAEQIQQLKGFITETNESAKTGRNKKVSYHVKWDDHDLV